MTIRFKRLLAALSVFVAVVMALAVHPGTAQAYSPWSNSYTYDELMLLARVVYAEADGEPYVGKVAVAAVVLNRVKSEQFPDTIWGVVYEPWQFSCVGNWMFNSAPSDESIAAARAALRGWDPTGGALYYFNYHLVTNPWLWEKPLAITLGAHRFTY